MGLSDATSSRTSSRGATVMSSLSMNDLSFIVATQRPVMLSS